MAVRNSWSATEAGAFKGRMAQPRLLRYRSNLLGSDKRVTNYGGGNTSCKTVQRDPLYRTDVEVLWVKGSGGDLGSMDLDGFAVLRMEALQQLKNVYRGKDHEDEMAEMLPLCAFGDGKRAASIDTPLHAFVPYAHVDHMHPDSVIALAASRGGKRMVAEVYGDRIGWLPWRRPGFELGLWLERYCRKNPKAIGVVLGSHGLFTWADDAETCYKRTLWAINQAERWVRKKTGRRKPFGRVAKPLTPRARREVAADLLPVLRGLAGQGPAKTGHFDDGKEVLEFVSSARLEKLARHGTSCPDHFLRTKIRPMVVPLSVAKRAVAGDTAELGGMFERYREDYAQYYERCRRPNSPAMRDPNAVIYLVPKVGMITLGANKARARIAAEFYTNAINVMRGAEGVDRYKGLPAQEAFDIEYWLLEEAKLQRMPKPKALSGRVAFVTGAAGGIGGAISERLLAEGANVVLADRDGASLEEAHARMAGAHGADVVRSAEVDVTDEEAVEGALRTCAVEFGGVDVVVCCAGLSTSAPVEDTRLDEWQLNMDVMGTGYFLVAREGFRLLRRQGTGGSVIFIASKNGLAASPNASAYCSAKAAEIHLARCLALEGGDAGIRVNVVNPDAVLRDSKMWSSSWRTDRARTYGISTSELEGHYRNRSVLKRSVYPSDVAESVFFLASDASAKSTGNVINVDAGHQVSFSR